MEPSWLIELDRSKGASVLARSGRPVSGPKAPPLPPRGGRQPPRRHLPAAPTSPPEATFKAGPPRGEGGTGMQRESRLPHVAIWAVAEARRLRAAETDASKEGDPAQVAAPVQSTANSTMTAPCASFAANPPLPQSLAFLVEWQMEHP
jgi:hypothetical protein